VCLPSLPNALPKQRSCAGQSRCTCGLVLRSTLQLLLRILELLPDERQLSSCGCTAGYGDRSHWALRSYPSTAQPLRTTSKGLSPLAGFNPSTPTLPYKG
jgi:hypothetical protein